MVLNPKTHERPVSTIVICNVCKEAEISCFNIIRIFFNINFQFEKIKLVWLGSNYPDPGEYNLESDTTPINYVLNTRIEMEIVTVRWGKQSGTAAVTLSKTDALKMLPGLGPKNAGPITGRHGGEFTNLGDYLANLFEHIPYDQGSDARALFDMAAVSVVKNPSWAQQVTVPAPKFVNGKWVDRPGNPHTIKVWENFNRDAIIGDFFKSLGYQAAN